MYCVRCGVRLQEGAKRCPLCTTPVWDPEETPEQKTYPDSLPRRQSESALAGAVLLTVLCLIAASAVLCVCFRLYGRLGWGSYALAGLLLFYGVAVLPCWFRRPRAEIFVPADHVFCALAALFVCVKTGGHWFLSFAFPVAGMSCLLFTALVCLLKYVKRGRLFILGGFFLVLGGFTMLAEFFEHITFGTVMFRWSLYSLICSSAVGLFLLVVGMIRPLREALERRFFF